ncbi:hypothetical protein RN001_005715 [Aquatica leii]|uniref:Uncharacterized protein n=1 Tax=Aquatica leii TaxID=1421715 RepID=A0AAN7PK94_9COLE|nr:hypothetical protein RN001_005715 [Aquatica leii]
MHIRVGDEGEDDPDLELKNIAQCEEFKYLGNDNLDDLPDSPFTSSEGEVDKIVIPSEEEIRGTSVEKSQRSGSGVDDLYTSHLWYFNLLMFLTDHELPTTSIDNIEDLTQELDLEVDNNKDMLDGEENNSIPSQSNINNEVRKKEKATLVDASRINKRGGSDEKRGISVDDMESQKRSRKPLSNTRKRNSKSRALKKRHVQAKIFNKNAHIGLDSFGTTSFALATGESTSGDVSVIQVDSESSAELTILKSDKTYSRKTVSKSVSQSMTMNGRYSLEAHPSTSTAMDYTFITKDEYDRQVYIQIINCYNVGLVFGK